MADAGGEPEVLARAGWRNAELIWEQIQEAGLDALERGEPGEAAELFAGALEVAREHFVEPDPRLATSLVNAAAAARDAGAAQDWDAALERAGGLWQDCGPWVEGLRPDHRARSSTFHLRLGARHRGGYRAIGRKRLEELVQIGAAAIDAHVRGVPEAIDRRHRWKVHKPRGYNDLRKLMAAALLIVPVEIRPES